VPREQRRLHPHPSLRGLLPDGSTQRLRFLFTCDSELKAPNWDHDPAKAAALMHRFTFEKACACSKSDHYKESGLRMGMWNHLCGIQPNNRGRSVGA